MFIYIYIYIYIYSPIRVFSVGVLADIEEGYVGFAAVFGCWILGTLWDSMGFYGTLWDWGCAADFCFWILGTLWPGDAMALGCYGI